jgi:glycosyltransferase involved in cell wall biosynthesis
MSRSVLIIGTEPAMLLKFHKPLIEALIARGATVDLAAVNLTSAKEEASELIALGAKLHDIVLARTGVNPLTDLRTFADMLSLIRAVRPDTVMAYTVKPVVYGMMAARVARVPRRFALIVGLGYSFTGRLRGKRALVNRISRVLYKAALLRATIVGFQNKDDQAAFRSLGLVGRTETTVIDGCGVDLEHFAAQPAPSGPPTFLMIGRLVADKGIREFVEAANIVRAKHPEARFRVLGGLDVNPTGVREDEVRSWEAAGAIEWLGYQRDVRPLLEECHAFVLPSYREGLPQAGIEALASGRAVVTTDAPGCREIVAPGENGILVPVADARALAEALIVLIRNPSELALMGKASRKLAEKRFDARDVSRRLLEIMDFPTSGAARP